METATEILIVILSVVLTIFLTVAIVVGVLAYKLLQSVKRISVKAEHIVENVEHVGDTFRNAAGPLALVKVIANIMRVVNKHK